MNLCNTFNVQAQQTSFQKNKQTKVILALTPSFYQARYSCKWNNVESQTAEWHCGSSQFSNETPNAHAGSIA